MAQPLEKPYGEVIRAEFLFGDRAFVYKNPAVGFNAPEVRDCFRELDNEEKSQMHAGSAVWADALIARSDGQNYASCLARCSVREVDHELTSGEIWILYLGMYCEQTGLHCDVKLFRLEKHEDLEKLIAKHGKLITDPEFSPAHDQKLIAKADDY